MQCKCSKGVIIHPTMQYKYILKLSSTLTIQCHDVRNYTQHCNILYKTLHWTWENTFPHQRGLSVSVKGRESKGCQYPSSPPTPPPPPQFVLHQGRSTHGMPWRLTGLKALNSQNQTHARQLWPWCETPAVRARSSLGRQPKTQFTPTPTHMQACTDIHAYMDPQARTQTH